MDELRRLDSSHDSTDEPFGSPADPFTIRREKKAKPARGDRPARPAPSRIARLVDLWAAALFTVVQVVLGGFLVVGAVLLGFEYDACGGPDSGCTYSLIPFAFYVVPGTAIVGLVATIIGIVMLRDRSRQSWWVPLAGGCLSLLAFGLSMWLTVIGTGRPLG